MLRRPIKFDIRQRGNQILLLLGALALANGVYYGFYTQPAVREYGRLLEISQGGDESLEGRREQVERLEAFRDGLSQATGDLARLRGDVLSTREQRLVDVHREVAQLAEQFNIDYATVSFANELLYEEELDRVGISIPLAGGYTNLRKFLQAVEGSDKFLVVERVALARGKQGGRLLDLNISLATYFTAPEELVRRKRDSRGVGRRRRS